jgi:hypothetical protein
MSLHFVTVFSKHWNFAIFLKDLYAEKNKEEKKVKGLNK